MKKLLVVLIALASVGAMLNAWRAASSDSEPSSLETPEPVDDPDPAPTDQPEAPIAASEPPSDRTASELAFPLVPVAARAAVLYRLADGDSMHIEWIDTGEIDELRLNGVNAPEQGACFGEDAGVLLETLIGADTLLVDGIERDEFGRIIADVWVGDRFLNAAVVESGAALALSGRGAHAEVISQAQEHAQLQGAGLWSRDACGSDPESTVVISEIVYDAPGGDDENPNGEWIEVFNGGPAGIDLSDFTIRDESTRHRYHFPAGFVLGAGQVVRVASGCGVDDSTTLYWCAGDPVWNNSGDTGFLIGSDGRFVDVYSYGSDE